jgi:excisionase family DNA binding protein
MKLCNKSDGSTNKKVDSFKKFFEKRKVGEEWLTSTEAARFLGISANALRIKVCRGQIKFRKLGSHLRFSVAELNCLLLKGA